MIKIVKTQRKHLKQLVIIGKQYWPYEKWIDNNYMRSTLRKKGFHFVALDKDKVVGGIMAVEEDYPKFWLYYFAVDKKHQGKGIGSVLLRAIESRLRKGNLIFVDLEKRDKTGLNFYLKHGFKVMGKVNKWFEGNHKGIILAKTI